MFQVSKLNNKYHHIKINDTFTLQLYKFKNEKKYCNYHGRLF